VWQKVKQKQKLKPMLFADKIRQLREEKQLLQRQLASALEIDTPMYSKLERGERRAKREQVIILSKLFEVDEEELIVLWLADQVTAVVANEKKIADKVLDVAKKHIKGN
jgi:transcriptional regulator with XRE-family HTH domain